MPEDKINARGGALRWRTIRVGKGKHAKPMRVAIVRRRGPKGGKTIAKEA